MKIINLVQGTPEWIAFRAGRNLHGQRRRPASLVPVMMGVSPHMTRSELVRVWATGDEREFTEWEKKFLLAKGLEAEAAARALLEEDLGEEFYPVTISDDADLNTASMDGLQMNDEDAFEHKLWNAELVEAIRREDPPAYIYWQLEGQLLAGTGSLKRIHLVCSDGTREKRVSMTYERVPGRYAKIEAGWRQFDEDVANYVHVAIPAKPAASAETIVALPALVARVDLTDLKVSDNLDAFGIALRTYIERINPEPATDQDFADAENVVKVMARAEEAVEAARSAILGQTGAIDVVLKRLEEFGELARQTRLAQGKRVEAKKVSIRADIRQEGVNAVAAHIQMLNTQLGKPYMPAVPHDFASAMRGKKTIASLRDAVATELAHFKIAANAVAGTITLNLSYLRESSGGYEALFADAGTLVLKEPEHFALVVTTRIDAYKKAEADRVEKLAEAAREKIRAEEQAKALALVAPAPLPPGGTATTPAPKLAVVPGATRGAPKASRPTDEEITAAVAQHFDVSIAMATEWLVTWERFGNAIVSP